MTLSSALDLFLTACRADGKAKSTVRWYKRRLGCLLAFLGDVEILQVSISDLRAFQVYLRDRTDLYRDNPYRQELEGSLSPSTLASYVRCVKAFFNWLEKEGHITTSQNPTLRLKRPSVPKQPPKEVSPDDIRRLLEMAAGSRKSPFLAVRDRAIILFLADTGCRVGGLANLRLSGLDLPGCSALVTEKGTKSRYVFFGPLTRSALEKYLEIRPSLDSDRVFVGERGPLSVYGVNQMLSKLKKRAGITGRVNPHSFRHHFAKAYLLNGGDLASLSDLMGHSDVTVTKNSYSVFLTEELKKKHHQHSPLTDVLNSLEY